MLDEALGQLQHYVRQIISTSQQQLATTSWWAVYKKTLELIAWVQETLKFQFSRTTNWEEERLKSLFRSGWLQQNESVRLSETLHSLFPILLAIEKKKGWLETTGEENTTTTNNTMLICDDEAEEEEASLSPNGLVLLLQLLQTLVTIEESEQNETTTAIILQRWQKPILDLSLRFSSNWFISLGSKKTQNSYSNLENKEDEEEKKWSFSEYYHWYQNSVLKEQRYLKIQREAYPLFQRLSLSSIRDEDYSSILSWLQLVVSCRERIKALEKTLTECGDDTTTINACIFDWKEISNLLLEKVLSFSISSFSSAFSAVAATKDSQNNNNNSSSSKNCDGDNNDVLEKESEDEKEKEHFQKLWSMALSLLGGDSFSDAIDLGVAVEPVMVDNHYRSLVLKLLERLLCNPVCNCDFIMSNGMVLFYIAQWTENLHCASLSTPPLLPPPLLLPRRQNRNDTTALCDEDDDEDEWDDDDAAPVFFQSDFLWVQKLKANWLPFTKIQEAVYSILKILVTKIENGRGSVNELLATTTEVIRAVTLNIQQQQQQQQTEEEVVQQQHGDSNILNMYNLALEQQNQLLLLQNNMRCISEELYSKLTTIFLQYIVKFLPIAEFTASWLSVFQQSGHHSSGSDTEEDCAVIAALLAVQFEAVGSLLLSFLTVLPLSHRESLLLSRNWPQFVSQVFWGSGGDNNDNNSQRHVSFYSKTLGLHFLCCCHDSTLLTNQIVKAVYVYKGDNNNNGSGGGRRPLNNNCNIFTFLIHLLDGTEGKKEEAELVLEQICFLFKSLSFSSSVAQHSSSTPLDLLVLFWLKGWFSCSDQLQVKKFQVGIIWENCCSLFVFLQGTGSLFSNLSFLLSELGKSEIELLELLYKSLVWLASNQPHFVEVISSSYVSLMGILIQENLDFGDRYYVYMRQKLKMDKIRDSAFCQMEENFSRVLNCIHSSSSSTIIV